MPTVHSKPVVSIPPIPDDLIGKLEIGTKDEMVKNPFTGKKILLDPNAVAMYDYMLGNERLVNHPLGSFIAPGVDFRKEYQICIDWFIHNHPEIYQVLID